MATKPKKKITRKSPKRYEMVSFEAPQFDGEFTLPKFPPPLGVMRKARKGDVDALVEWLEDADVDQEFIDAIDSLDVETEFEEFIGAWSKGDLASAPKSGA